MLGLGLGLELGLEQGLGAGAGDRGTSGAARAQVGPAEGTALPWPWEHSRETPAPGTACLWHQHLLAPYLPFLKTLKTLERN